MQAMNFYRCIQLFDAALTLLQNKDSIIPLKGLDTLTIATVSFGEKELSAFQKTVDLYAKADHTIFFRASQKLQLIQLLNH